MSTHAILGPSSAHRWMFCAGAPAMEHGLPDTSSEYADEGTAAHFFASECLKAGVHPATHIGRKIAVGLDATWWLAPNDVVGFGTPVFEVDIDMAGHVNTYVQAVLAEGGQMLVEQSLPIAWMTGEEGACGTADTVIFRPNGELQVHDLKYGQGERVLAKDNPQLMLYGLAALEEYAMLGDFTSLRLFIHQPRVHGAPSEWLFPADQWAAFTDRVREAAKTTTVALEHRDNWIGKSMAYLTPGEKQCRWCRAKADCPALSQMVQDEVGAEFAEMPAVLDIDIRPEDLGAKLTAVPLIETWCKAVRAEAERALFSGEPVTGFKLVQGKRGNRAWADATQAESVLKGMRLKIEEMYDLKLISPTTAEKLSKAGTIGPRQWKKVQEMIVQPEGKPSVAPDTDPRPPLALHTASEDFSGLDDGGDLA